VTYTFGGRSLFLTPYFLYCSNDAFWHVGVTNYSMHRHFTRQRCFCADLSPNPSDPSVCQQPYYLRLPETTQTVNTLTAVP